jgi:hypothetical protein
MAVAFVLIHLLGGHCPDQGASSMALHSVTEMGSRAHGDEPMAAIDNADGAPSAPRHVASTAECVATCALLVLLAASLTAPRQRSIRAISRQLRQKAHQLSGPEPPVPRALLAI